MAIKYNIPPRALPSDVDGRAPKKKRVTLHPYQIKKNVTLPPLKYLEERP